MLMFLCQSNHREKDGDWCQWFNESVALLTCITWHDPWSTDLCECKTGNGLLFLDLTGHTVHDEACTLWVAVHKTGADDLHPGAIPGSEAEKDGNVLETGFRIEQCPRGWAIHGGKPLLVILHGTALKLICVWDESLLEFNQAI